MRVYDTVCDINICVCRKKARLPRKCCWRGRETTRYLGTVYLTHSLIPAPLSDCHFSWDGVEFKLDEFETGLYLFGLMY